MAGLNLPNSLEGEKRDTSSAGSQEGTITEIYSHKVYESNGAFGEGQQNVNVEGNITINVYLYRNRILIFFSPPNRIAAIDEYAELKKELSRMSRKSSNAAGKLEEGTVDQDDFNLSNFLHGMSNDSTEAGHQPKHLGVVWKNLTVEVNILDFYIYFFSLVTLTPFYRVSARMLIQSLQLSVVLSKTSNFGNYSDLAQRKVPKLS